MTGFGIPLLSISCYVSEPLVCLSESGWLGSLGDHLVGSSAHPTRQLKKIVLAHPVGQGVGKLP